jgi:hypothetical protein
LPCMFVGHRSCHCRLARAGQAAEPEDTWRVDSIRPAVYILEKGDTGIREADRIVLTLVCVVLRVRGNRYSLEYIILRCFAGQLLCPDRKHRTIQDQNSP